MYIYIYPKPCTRSLLAPLSRGVCESRVQVSQPMRPLTQTSLSSYRRGSWVQGLGFGFASTSLGVRGLACSSKRAVPPGS